MERNIVLLSGITDDQKNLLAAGGVNSATDLSMLEHDDVKGILTTASVVLTRKLWRIGKYVAAGQTVQATTTLADIRTFFAMPTRPRAAAAPVPPTAPNTLEVMRGAPIQMRQTSELIPHPPFLLEEKKANHVAPEEITYDWKRFVVSFERSGKVGMTLRESKNTLDPVTDLTKGSQKQVTTVTRVVAKGQAEDAGVRANDVMCLFSYSPVNDYKTCPINVWHGHDSLINYLKLPKRPVYALGLRKVRKKKVIVKKEKVVVDSMPENNTSWISSRVSVSPIINEKSKAIPMEIRKNFRKIGFCKFGGNWLPAIEVGPDDVAAHLSDEWMKKFKKKENYYTHLVYWYGEEPNSGYGWFEHEVWSKKFVSFGVGKKKGYSDVPIAIVKKLDKKMKLAKEQQIRLDAIHQIKGDYLLPKEKRIAWLTGTAPVPRSDENTETSKINRPEKHHTEKRKQMDIKSDVDDEAKHRSRKLHSKRN